MKPIKLAVIIFGVLAAILVGLIVFVATTFDSARLKAELTSFVQEKKQRTLRIDGDVALSFWPNVGIRLGKASLSEYRSDKEFAAIDGARVSVAVMPLLSKRIVVDSVELDGARVTLIKHKDGTLNIADLLSKDKSDSAPVQVDISGIQVGNARLTWVDEQSGQSTVVSGLDLTTGAIAADTGKQVFQAAAVKLAAKGKTGSDAFEVRLELPKLAVSGGQASGERLLLTANLVGGERRVAATLTITGIESGAESIKIDKVELEADATVGDATVKGKLATNLSAKPAEQVFAFDKIEGNIELASPKMPMKSVKLPLSGHLRAELAKQAAQGALTTRFDDSTIALKFDVEKFSPLALGFDLDIDQLNVDKYLPPAKPGDAGKAGKAGDGGKLDLSALKGLNVHGAVRIGRFQINQVKANNIKLQVKATGGKLDIAPHSMNLYDGTLTGALSVNADGNSVAVSETLTGININPLMKDLANQDLLEGNGNVRFDITTRGETVGAMKKALGGTASVVLRNGALKGINLAQSFREAKALLSSRQDAVQQAKATDKTDFSELTASFRIANGVAHNQDLSAKSPFLRLGGAGDIDIGNGRLDYVAKASVVATSGGQGAKELAHLQGLTVPVRARGPFDQLSYQIEYAALAEGAVKAKVEEKKEELKQRAKDEVLKGLFGR